MCHYRIQCNFGGIDDLCKLGIFTRTDIQIKRFILDKILKVFTYYTHF